jgi:hypothetical protein
LTNLKVKTTTLKETLTVFTLNNHSVNMNNTNLDFINQLQERVKNIQSANIPTSLSSGQVADRGYTGFPPNPNATHQFLEDASIHLRNAHSRIVLIPEVPIGDLHDLLECIGRVEHIAKKLADIQSNYK